MKKIISLFIFMSIISVLVMPAFAAAPGISATSAILVSADTGEVLYEHDADKRMLIASTTKIMTAIVVIENCDMDEKVKIDARSAGVEGSSMYLKSGDTYTVEQLLYGMMLVSGNDAAMALALYVAGSTEEFAAMMNDKAAELGMTNSHFKNPHGLDEDGHYSTARDLAVLGAYCMKNEEFTKIVSTRSINIGEQTLLNHNKLLFMYDGCLGLKTGYTNAAGRSLVSCAERGGERFVCVTLEDPDDWDDHEALYDWAFANWRYIPVVSKEQTFSLPVVSGTADHVTVAPAEDVKALLPTNSVPEISIELPRFVFAPVYAGAAAGGISVYLDGERIASGEMVFSDAVELEKGIKLTPWERFGRVWAMAGRSCAYSYYLTGEKK